MIVCAVLFISYAFLSKAWIPIQSISCEDIVLTNSGDMTTDYNSCTTTSDKLQIKVSFPVYVVAIISFVGWIFFIVFAGVGFAT